MDPSKRLCADAPLPTLFRTINRPQGIGYKVSELRTSLGYQCSGRQVWSAGMDKKR
jgi:hypothetical protein